MSKTIMIAALLGAAALCLGCESDRPKSPAVKPAAKPAASQPTPSASKAADKSTPAATAMAEPDEAPLPVPADFEAEADRQITEKTYKAELEKIEKAITSPAEE